MSASCSPITHHTPGKLLGIDGVHLGISVMTLLLVPVINNDESILCIKASACALT